MLRSKNIDRICITITAIALVIALLLMYLGERNLISKADAEPRYVSRIFDTSYVHTINIKLDDWDSFIADASGEEYVDATLEIDGEIFKNVALRAKGNTSLSQVSNNRYSFKVEFDHYKSSNTYYGLDKLCLNNVIQDTTYMKDYLAYTFMNKMGVAAPLCSYVWIQVNGQDWGLYLAVEAVEDSFLERIGASAKAELYKPDSLSLGGGRGNGAAFDMKDFLEDAGARRVGGSQSGAPYTGSDTMPEQPATDNAPAGGDQSPSDGMGSDDVKLIYSGDDPAGYSNIFDNAKTQITDSDKARLINALKQLSEGDVEDCVNISSVITYMAVHNFMDNDDSYTGSMVHNYYLLEQDGVLTMIPWDYNLSFGTFSGSDATGSVNTPIATIAADDRPMATWIMNSDEYMEQYLMVYGEFIDEIFTSGWFDGEFERVTSMIAEYVEKDPTAFYGYESFEKGISTLKEYIDLRVQSVKGQLDGSIPSTQSGQTESDALTDASDIDLTLLGVNDADGDAQQYDARGDMAPPVNEQPQGTGAPPYAPQETPDASDTDTQTPPAPKPEPDSAKAAPDDASTAQPVSTSTYLTAAGCLVLLLAALIVASRYTKRG